jgi:hypothetical protein
MVGLSRSDASAEAADGVIHTAFNYDFSNLKQTSEEDCKAIETLARCCRLGYADELSPTAHLQQEDFRVSEDDNNRARRGRCLERELLRNKEKLCQ